MRYLPLLFVFWLLFLLGGVLTIWVRQKNAPTQIKACVSREVVSLQDHYLAVKAMPSNYRLLEKDLLWDVKSPKRPDRTLFLGKYLGCSLRAGDPVMLDDLRDAPEIK